MSERRGLIIIVPACVIVMLSLLGDVKDWLGHEWCTLIFWAAILTGLIASRLTTKEDLSPQERAVRNKVMIIAVSLGIVAAAAVYIYMRSTGF